MTHKVKTLTGVQVKIIG